MRRFMLGLKVAACIALIGAAWWLRLNYKQFVWFHFVEVKPGVLYRSGQLSARQLEDAVRRYGLRTVVNLRTVGEDPAAFAAEAAACRRLGVEFVHLPMGYGAPETELQIDRFVKLARERVQRPILVHCRHGMTRTGFAVLAYRHHFDGWRLGDAAAELKHYGDEQDLAHMAKWVRISTASPAGPGPTSHTQEAFLPLDSLIR